MYNFEFKVDDVTNRRLFKPQLQIACQMSSFFSNFSTPWLIFVWDIQAFRSNIKVLAWKLVTIQSNVSFGCRILFSRAIWCFYDSIWVKSFTFSCFSNKCCGGFHLFSPISIREPWDLFYGSNYLRCQFLIHWSRFSAWSFGSFDR